MMESGEVCSRNSVRVVAIEADRELRGKGTLRRSRSASAFRRTKFSMSASEHLMVSAEAAPAIPQTAAHLAHITRYSHFVWQSRVFIFINGAFLAYNPQTFRT